MRAVRDGVARERPDVCIKWWPVEDQDELERPMGWLRRPGCTEVIRLDVRNAKVIRLDGTDVQLDDPDCFRKLAG